MRGWLTAIAAAWAASVAALLDVFYEFLDCSPAKLVRLAGLLARGRSRRTAVDSCPWRANRPVRFRGLEGLARVAFLPSAF